MKDNSTLPKQLKYYFVELGDNEYEFNLDQETINNLSDIKKLTSIIPPMKNINEKVLEEIRLKKNVKKLLEFMIEFLKINMVQSKVLPQMLARQLDLRL